MSFRELQLTSSDATLKHSEWSTIGEFCGQPGFDTRIGISGISSNITIPVAAIAVGAVAAIAIIAIALNRKRKKKKGSYGVNLDSPKYHIAPEDDLQMSETKSNLIIKV